MQIKRLITSIAISSIISVAFFSLVIYPIFLHCFDNKKFYDYGPSLFSNISSEIHEKTYIAFVAFTFFLTTLIYQLLSKSTWFGRFSKLQLCVYSISILQLLFFVVFPVHRSHILLAALASLLVSYDQFGIPFSKLTGQVRCFQMCSPVFRFIIHVSTWLTALIIGIPQ